MRKRNICRLIAAFLTLLLAGSLLSPVACAAIVTTEKPVINTFVPAGEEQGGLLIHKKVEHPFGDGYTVPSELKFDFNIALGAYYADAKIATTAGTLKADAEGNLLVSLKAGESLGLQDLEAGREVTVTELLREGSGFTVQGEATRKVKIPATGDAELTFINVYSPEAVQPLGVTLRGEKKLTGRNWTEEDAFTVLLERQTAEGWEQVSSATLTKGNTTFDFSKKLQKERFTALGKYNYRVTEQKGNAANVTYDDTVYPLCITVTDRDMDGKLEIASVTGSGAEKGENGSYSALITFENIYSKPAAPDQPSQPDQPTDPSDPQKPQVDQPTQGAPSPDTGERFDSRLWIAVLVLSISGLAALYLTRKHWKRD